MLQRRQSVLECFGAATAIGALVLLLSGCARAVDMSDRVPKKVPHIGYLSEAEAHYPFYDDQRLPYFQQGLRDLGYVEGENIIVEYRFAQGDRERLKELAVELEPVRK